MENHTKYSRDVIPDIEESLSKIVAKISANSVVLDIGCSSGMLGRYLVLQKECVIDGVDIATLNAENVAGGFSITPAIADEFFANGIDLMTSGNHIFDKHEIIPYLEKNPKLLRPANYPPTAAGKGLFVGEINGFKIAALNLLGRIFMPPVDDPFRVADECVESIPDDVKIRLVDMHCEATSEKYAMGWF